MKEIRELGTFGVVWVGTVLVLVASAASATATQAGTHVPLPFEQEGSIDGAAYRIVVPENWNGTLLVWAHGLRDKADHPGEVDRTFPEAAPGFGQASSLANEQELMAEGFAVAGSAYRDNGFAVKEGIQDTRALTNLFKGAVGTPTRTIIWGASLGSIVALELLEEHEQLYDGAIGLCTQGAGSAFTWDSFLALALAYEAAFGWPVDWGLPEDVPDDLDFETTVLPVLLQQLQNPANFGRFEFVRMVNDLPIEGFYGNFLFTDFFIGTETRAELERRAGGSPVQNLEHVYSLTADEKLVLSGLGVDADALLELMNARRVAPIPAPRKYVEKYAIHEGDIAKPVLTMHTTIDGLLPTWQERAYQQAVAVNGDPTLLQQVYTDSVGHCTFSIAQIVAAAKAMDFWVSTGVAPGPEFFPEALGFVPGFEPLPLPYRAPE